MSTPPDAAERFRLRHEASRQAMQSASAALGRATDASAAAAGAATAAVSAAIGGGSKAELDAQKPRRRSHRSGGTTPTPEGERRPSPPPRNSRRKGDRSNEIAEKEWKDATAAVQLVKMNGSSKTPPTVHKADQLPPVASDLLSFGRAKSFPHSPMESDGEGGGGAGSGKEALRIAKIAQRVSNSAHARCATLEEQQKQTTAAQAAKLGAVTTVTGDLQERVGKAEKKAAADTSKLEERVRLLEREVRAKASERDEENRRLRLLLRKVEENQAKGQGPKAKKGGCVVL